MITVSFKCGHQAQSINPDVQVPPVCDECGERQIANVQAPAPRITGAGSGPLMVKGSRL